MIKGNKAVIGGETVLWIPRIFLLIIVATVITFIVFSAFGRVFDVRQVEAAILAEKISNCLIDKGILNVEKLSNPEFLELCKISLSDEQYLLKIDVKDLEGKEIKKFFYGYSDIEKYCEMKEIMTNYPKCIENSYYVLIENSAGQTQAKMNIFVGILKTGKNLPK